MKKVAFITLFLSVALNVFSFRVQTEVNEYKIAEGQEASSIEFVHLVHNDNGDFLGFMRTSARENHLDKIEILEAKKFSKEDAEKVLQSSEFKESVNNALQLYHFLQDGKLGQMTGKPVGEGRCEIEFKNAVAGTYSISVIGPSSGEVINQKIIMKDGDNTMLFAFVPVLNLDGKYQVKVVGEEMGYQGFLKLSE